MLSIFPQGRRGEGTRGEEIPPRGWWSGSAVAFSVYAAGGAGGQGGQLPPSSNVRARASANDLGLECACLGCLALVRFGNRTAELLYRCFANEVRTIRPPAVVALHLLSLAVLPGLFHSDNAFYK